MGKKSLSIEILEKLSPYFLSGELIELNDFLKHKNKDLNTIKVSLDSLIKNSFINNIDNLDSLNNLIETPILTCITKGGEDYLKSYFETQFHKSMTRWTKNKDVILAVLAMLSFGFAVYTWVVKSGKDNEINTKNGIIKTQGIEMDSMQRILYNLKRNN